jgi:hypothetical protein
MPRVAQQQSENNSSPDTEVIRGAQDESFDDSEEKVRCRELVVHDLRLDRILCCLRHVLEVLLRRTVEEIHSAESCERLEPEMPYSIDKRDGQRRGCLWSFTLRRSGRVVTCNRVLSRGAVAVHLGKPM